MAALGGETLAFFSLIIVMAEQQGRTKPPSKKLALNKRVFNVTLEMPNGDEVELKAADGTPIQMFSQALHGRLELVSSDELQPLRLVVEWDHPEREEDAPKSAPFFKRRRRNDVRSLSALLLEKHYKAHYLVTVAGGCKRSSDIAPDRGGYLRVNVDYTWFRFTHVIMQYEHNDNVFAAAERLNLPVSQVDCSHLCGNNWCCNSAHLVFENHKINMERNVCHARKRCIGHANAVVCLFVE
ncbi:MAG: hypothetical protein JSR57_08550 [Verrucomicrobia bacterium]|nr:hypothetical protein [Verrucomicrobiota bacterium]